MSENKIHFYKTASDASIVTPAEETQRLEPSTCVEAETFALRVLDDSMEPEFRTNCIIVIDPTGHARDGSYVLANKATHKATNTSDTKHPSTTTSEITIDEAEEALEPVVFRQLRRVNDGEWQLCPLNENYASEPTAADLSDIIGVIVQRAGIRRRYHKHYN